MKKSMLKIALSILLVAVVLVGGTLAYLVTQTEILTNTFAVVDINTEIDEPEDPDHPKQPAKEKSASVKNSSNVSVYVRAIAVVTTEEGSEIPVSAGDVGISYVAVPPDSTTDGWFYNETDQYYYYTRPVEANGSTTLLFDGVTVDDLGDNADKARFAVYVYHESVEAKELNVPENASAGQKASAIAALFQ